MRALILLFIGLIFTTLLVLAPAIHASTWLGTNLGGAAWILIALPYLVLVIALMTTREWLKLYLFPVAHLPALAAVPALTDRLVYEGGGGFWPLAATAVTGTAWFAVTIWPAMDRHEERRPRRRIHPLTGVSVVMGLGVFGVFVAAAFGTSEVEPLSANLTLVAGGLASWYVVARALVTNLGDVALDPQARSRYRTTLLLGRRPARRAVLATSAAAALTLLVMLLWYTLR